MKKKLTSDIPYYEFKGSWKEIGFQYGQACKEEFQYMLKWWVNAFSSMYDYSLDEMKEATKAFIEPVKEYSPEIYAQLEGMCEGSGCSMEEIMFLNGAFELDEAMPVYMNMGCTSFACGDSATKDGKVITGQNLDWAADSKVFAAKIIPDEGSKFLTFGFCGNVGMVGLNEYGISCFVNMLVRSEVQVGVPVNFISYKALFSKNAADAIGAVSSAKRSIPWNYMIASRDGSMIDVESTIEHCAYILPTNDIIAHSNHFVTSWLQAGDKVPWPDTFLRRFRMQKLLEAANGEVTPEYIMEKVLTDERDYPDSICRQLDLEGPAYEQFESSISFVCVPAEGVIYATLNPKEHPVYTKFTI